MRLLHTYVYGFKRVSLLHFSYLTKVYEMKLLRLKIIIIKNYYRGHIIILRCVEPKQLQLTNSWIKPGRCAIHMVDEVDFSLWSDGLFPSLGQGTHGGPYGLDPSRAIRLSGEGGRAGSTGTISNG
jgi:hypothetical protein